MLSSLPWEAREINNVPSSTAFPFILRLALWGGVGGESSESPCSSTSLWLFPDPGAFFSSSGDLGLVPPGSSGLDLFIAGHLVCGSWERKRPSLSFALNVTLKSKGTVSDSSPLAPTLWNPCAEHSRNPRACMLPGVPRIRGKAAPRDFVCACKPQESLWCRHACCYMYLETHLGMGHRGRLPWVCACSALDFKKAKALPRQSGFCKRMS